MTEANRISILFEIVRSLDGVLNNTSLILLFEIGKTKLLFPGDAQIENWSHCLFDAPEKERNKWRRLLSDVALYKVGHHGSLNATPKTLWESFSRKSKTASSERLKTLMSTRPGKHGSPQARTEVPRKPLVDELKALSELDSTLDVKMTDLFKDVVVEV